MKDHVRANFDASADAYAAYEARTGRFGALATRLLEELSARAGRPLGTVLDAGAGSGAGTRVLGERASVLALDASGEMLRGNPADRRLQGDFDRLPLVDGCVDAVAFTASLFLTPEPGAAAAEARRVLAPGGAVGAAAPLGWTDPDGRDVFEPLDRTPRSPAGADAVEAALRAAFDGVAAGEWAFETTAADLRRFHAVPAMAARLYPRLEPGERAEQTRRLLADVAGPLRQRWRWVVGVRPE